MKRRVASLPPISADIFTDKVLQARAASTAEADKAYFEKSCEACTKTYYSENAYQNHLTSQKHKANLAAAASRPDDETKSVVSSTFSLGEPTMVAKDDVDSDAEDEFNHVIEGLQKAKLEQQGPSPIKRPANPQPAKAEGGAEEDEEDEERASTANGSGKEPTWNLRSCIFCNFESPTVPLNAHHMERFHGMFIPEKQYLVDLDGLVQQLQFQIAKGLECIFCQKVKTNVYAVQTHMRDTGHCKIPYTTEDEQLSIGEYYDFRSTYSDGAESDSDSEDETGGARVSKGDGAKEAAEDDGWETDSSESSLDSEDLTAVPAEGHYHQFDRLNKHPHHAKDDPRPHRQADGFHSRAHKHNHAVFYDDYELHLPSGKSVGHRSHNKYFRQNLTHYPTPEERAERAAITNGEDDDERHFSDDDNSNAARIRRNRQVVPRGTAGMVGASDKAKGIAKKEEKRSRKAQIANNKKRDLAYGISHNNQKHYYYRYDGGG